jgi:ribonuclease T1
MMRRIFQKLFQELFQPLLPKITQARWVAVNFALLFSLLIGVVGGLEAKPNLTLFDPTIAVQDLPREAREILVLIKQGGPFRYPKDGVVFGNRERLLPKQKRGYYAEYTVKTPGEKSRGARRIVAGGDPKTSGEYYYTDDHYASFKRIRE